MDPLTLALGSAVIGGLGGFFGSESEQDAKRERNKQLEKYIESQEKLISRAAADKRSIANQFLIQYSQLENPEMARGLQNTYTSSLASYSSEIRQLEQNIDKAEMQIEDVQDDSLLAGTMGFLGGGLSGYLTGLAFE